MYYANRNRYHAVNRHIVSQPDIDSRSIYYIDLHTYYIYCTIFFFSIRDYVFVHTLLLVLRVIKIIMNSNYYLILNNFLLVFYMIVQLMLHTVCAISSEISLSICSRMLQTLYRSVINKCHEDSILFQASDDRSCDESEAVYQATDDTHSSRFPGWGTEIYTCWQLVVTRIPATNVSRHYTPLTRRTGPWGYDILSARIPGFTSAKYQRPRPSAIPCT